VTALVELVISADPDAWRDAGFAVDGDGVSQIGLVRLRLDPTAGAPGIRSWSFVAAPDPGLTDLDGLPTGHVEPPPEPAPADVHPIGAAVIDHVVVLTPDLARTIATVERDLGVPLRRVRDAGPSSASGSPDEAGASAASGETGETGDTGGAGQSGGSGASGQSGAPRPPMRQAFFRLGEVVLEVVGGAEPDPRGGPAHWYGIAITVRDLDAAVRLLGERVGGAKPAVQPGRSIATVRERAGLGLPVALMSPSARP
jgi:glyoxalase/bleomycin resistance protein/dioxygenase superfamily protein